MNEMLSEETLKQHAKDISIEIDELIQARINKYDHPCGQLGLIQPLKEHIYDLLTDLIDNIAEIKYGVIRYDR